MTFNNDLKINEVNKTAVMTYITVLTLFLFSVQCMVL